MDRDESGALLDELVNSLYGRAQAVADALKGKIDRLISISGARYYYGRPTIHHGGRDINPNRFRMSQDIARGAAGHPCSRRMPSLNRANQRSQRT